jgi:hypothetical protein
MKKIYYLQPEPFDPFLTDAETIQLTLKTEDDISEIYEEFEKRKTAKRIKWCELKSMYFPSKKYWYEFWKN